MRLIIWIITGVVCLITLGITFGVKYALTSPSFTREESILSNERVNIALVPLSSSSSTTSTVATSSENIFVLPGRTIQVTGGVKHSVPLSSIRSGGPAKDGIPSIDSPKFISQSEATFLKDNELGIAFSRGGTTRFYPFQILVWHEIVNDTIEGQKTLITYCPLCLSAIVFDPLVGEERVAFGTSGKLWNSNLIMYDRKTDSQWSQILGEAIVGELTGQVLPILPSDQITYGAYKRLYPNGEVLSRETGALNFYGQDPYGNYYTSNDLFFPVDTEDTRLQRKDYVLGLTRNGQAKAWLPDAVRRTGELRETFAGIDLVLQYDEISESLRIYEDINGELIQLNPFGSFWFSWVSAYPDTELFK